jgi:hypothetical protein
MSQQRRFARERVMKMGRLLLDETILALESMAVIVAMVVALAWWI